MRRFLVSDEHLLERRGIVRDVVLEFGGYSPIGLLDHSQCFATASRSQPSGQPLRVFDPIQVLDELQPHGLSHVLGCRVIESEAARRGPHHLTEPIDQRIPGRPVAVGCELQQFSMGEGFDALIV